MRRVELATLLDGLRSGNNELLEDAVSRSALFTPPAYCIDESSLEKMLAPPEVALRPLIERQYAALARITLQPLLEDRSGAREGVRKVGELAASLSWPPLEAEARLQEGVISHWIGDYAVYERAAADAYHLAAGAGDWPLAARAAMTAAEAAGAKPGNLDEAKRWLAHAEAAVDRSGDPFGALRAALMFIRGGVLYDQGLLEEAIEELGRAVTAMRASYGQRHPEVGVTYQNLGSALREAGRFDEAMTELGRAITTLRETMGASHPVTAVARAELAAVHHRLSRFEDALSGYHQAANVFRNALGADHRNTIVARLNEGILRGELGDTERALEILSDNVPRMARILGTEDPAYWVGLRNLGALQVQTGRPEIVHVRAILEAATEAAREGPSVSPIVFARLRRTAGVELEAAGDLETALSVHEEALEVQVSAGIKNTKSSVQASMLAVGRVRVDLGRPGEALPLLEELERLRGSEQLVLRPLGRARWQLARALWDAPPPKRDRARARALAQAAVVDFDTHRFGKNDADRIRAWLAAHPDAQAHDASEGASGGGAD